MLIPTGSAGTGLLSAARGLGALLGPLIVRRFYVRRPDRLFPGLAVAMLVYGVSYLAIATFLWLPAVVGLILLAHGAGASNWSMSSAAMQALIPDELRGRVLSVDLMIMTLVVIFGSLVLLALWTGFLVLSPNESRVVLFFGWYAGTVRRPGFHWTVPFSRKRKISLRVRNFESAVLKVADADGNPVQIGAVVVWRGFDT